MIKLTELERFAVYHTMARPGAWGGGQESLLAQDEVYSALGLARFERVKPNGDGQVLLSSFRGGDVKVRLTGRAGHLLKTILAAPGQDFMLGRQSASALRKLLADAVTMRLVARYEKAQSAAT